MQEHMLFFLFTLIFKLDVSRKKVSCDKPVSRCMKLIKLIKEGESNFLSGVLLFLIPTRDKIQSTNNLTPAQKYKVFILITCSVYR